MKKLVAVAVVSLFAASVGFANTFVERFTADPSQDGWQAYGNTNLFTWDSTNQVLDVTWDSTQPDSFFYQPLNRTLTAADSFCVVIDFQLNDAVGIGYSSELGIGLFNFSDATNVNNVRTWGTQPNVFEFDYFPPDEFGDPASDDASLSDALSNFYFPYDNITLISNVTYHVLLLHQAGAPVISGEIFTNGVLMTSLPNLYTDIPADDPGTFQLDTLSISSYYDGGTNFNAGNDILAHGFVSKIAVASPLPVQAIQQLAAEQVRFGSDTNWLYTLEQTADFQSWSPAALPVSGNGANLILQATNSPSGKSFYNVRADLP